MTLKEIAIELLEKYEASENVAICEYSTNINKDMDLLEKEVKKYRRMIENADRKTEPTISKMEQVDEPQTNADQHVQHVESVKDETGHWVRVGQWEWEHHTDTTHFGKTKGESITTNKVEDEPQTERSE